MAVASPEYATNTSRRIPSVTVRSIIRDISSWKRGVCSNKLSLLFVTVIARVDLIAALFRKVNLKLVKIEEE